MDLEVFVQRDVNNKFILKQLCFGTKTHVGIRRGRNSMDNDAPHRKTYGFYISLELQNIHYSHRKYQSSGEIFREI